MRTTHRATKALVNLNHIQLATFQIKSLLRVHLPGIPTFAS